MRASARPRADLGFTLVEIMAAVVVLMVVGWVSIEATALTSKTSLSTTQISELDQRVHRTLTRVVRELQEARLELLVPNPVKPLGASTLTYQCAELTDNDDIVWGALRRLELVSSSTDPLDGKDNDHDGLVDEHELRLVRDVGLPTEYATVLVHNVAPLLEGEEGNALDDNGNGLLDEAGFCVARRDDVLDIRISLLGKDVNQRVSIRTAETTVWPRN